MPRQHSNTESSRTLPRLIAIVGGSGAGKSWLADRLQRELRGAAALVSLDNFYRDRSHLPPHRREQINFDHPRAMDWELVERVLSECRAGRSTQIPQYDFATHTRLPSQRALVPKPAVLMEGLWLLRRRSVRRLFDLSIFVDCPADLRFKRRLARDLLERGRTVDSVRRQFRKMVEPMNRQHVRPQLRHADVVVRQPAGEKEWRKVLSEVQSLLNRSTGRKARRRL